MLAVHLRRLLLCLSFSATFVFSQANTTQIISAETAIDDALKLSSLSNSKTPFHALLQIDGPTASYKGSVEVRWIADQKYALTAVTPTFQRTVVINGASRFEKNEGDYYPRWLENLINALLNPIPIAENFKGRGAQLQVGAGFSSSCLKRDDRLDGITDQLTWGIICFSFSGRQPILSSVLSFTTSLEFSDFRSFAGLQVARTYSTTVLDYKPVIGRLTLLEELKDFDEAQLLEKSRAPTSDRIGTTFVSTQQEEKMVEAAPVIQWPLVREGKTQGYMIVYARTDRTGQVRESAKHNSDNPGLEQFGMEQALRYKFKPLLVDDVPQQMEMPLVLHFVTARGDPLPLLADPQTRSLISGCKLPTAKPSEPTYIDRVSVNEQGKLTGEGFPQANTPGYVSPSRLIDLSNCHFAPFLVNGQPVYYHGDLLLPR